MPVDAPMEQVLALFEMLRPPAVFVTSRAGGVLVGALSRESLQSHANN